MLCIAISLISATVIRLALQKKNPQKDYTELRQRIQSWWWMVGLLFGVLIIGVSTTIAFIGFLSFLALKEFLSITPTRQIDRRAIFWLYLSIPFQYYWISIGWYGMFIIFIPVYIFLIVPIRMVMLGQTEGFIKSAGTLHFAAMLTIFCISHLAYLLVLPTTHVEAGSIGLVLCLLILTQFNDVAQYIWGKLFGKHKIIPKISPNKTTEGFLGGLITIVSVSYFLGPYLTSLSSISAAIAGGLISVSGFFGDLVISSVKRDLEIKDTGNLIPGHGGILDRLDSLIFTAPVFFHYIYYLEF